jgi:8-oxo-dGTP pyrophosphatase MutT (NUDIX family)
MTSDSDILPKKIVVAAMGLPINNAGKYLLTRRHAPSIPAWHNKWQVCGGELEFGETLEEALEREFQEEIGVIPNIIFPQPIVKTSIWYGKETDKSQDTQIILTTYLVDIGEQQIDITHDDETSNYNWFSLSEVMKLESLPMTTEIVTDAEKILKTNRALRA